MYSTRIVLSIFILTCNREETLYSNLFILDDYPTDNQIDCHEYLKAVVDVTAWSCVTFSLFARGLIITR